MLSLIPTSSIEDRIHQVITESNIEFANTDFDQLIQQIGFPSTFILTSKDDTFSPYQIYDQIKSNQIKSNQVTTDILSGFKYEQLNSLASTNEYSTQTIESNWPQ